MATVTEKLIDVNELAELIGYERSSLIRWARDGKIPSYRFPGEWRFKASEVLEAFRTRPDKHAEAKYRSESQTSKQPQN